VNVPSTEDVVMCVLHGDSGDMRQGWRERACYSTDNSPPSTNNAIPVT